MIHTFDWVYDWKSYLSTGISETLANHLSPHYFKFHQNATQNMVMSFKDKPDDGKIY